MNKQYISNDLADKTLHLKLMNMRKSIILLAFILGGFTVGNAQSVVEGTKLTDNWSVGVNAGGVTPLTHSAFFKGMRPTFGVGVSKQLTPIFGLGFQGMGYINTTSSKTAFDASDVSVLGKVNLMNLFASYTGEPRLFEVEAVAGMGWLHYYVNGDGDQNSWSTRLGLNFNFNLGESKAWTLGIKPAIVYDMQGTYPETKSRFNANNAGFELTAGLTYHFKTSNGTHHFAKVRVYNQAEIDGLNSSINALRADVNNKDGEISNANQRINGLQEELEACRKQSERWAKLNDLAGSADGAKFRRIAQGYTLDVLLSYANVQLRDLSRRYRLERVPETLALQVIDRDMCDEVRTVHSLSGGESFLVSLALALGLSSLSSNRMKVESLFIDEGFGSLDADTLRIAMDALESLRTQGRKIGVISHVQEMTERIPVQIRVNRAGNGRSYLEVI